MNRGKPCTAWKVRPLIGKADLVNDHKGRLGDFEVIDIHFAGTSIFTRWNKHGKVTGDWPTIERLCGFVCMLDYPDPTKVSNVVRYETTRGAVYRLYVKAEVA
jgi:hypothetical protein